MLEVYCKFFFWDCMLVHLSLVWEKRM